MRKFLSTILFAILSLSLFAQNEPIQNDSVLQVPNVSSDQIYQRINAWFVSFAKHDSRSLIQLQDDEKKHIVGSFSFPYHDNALSYLNMEGYITAVFDITARDGRFRVKCYQYSHSSSKAPGNQDFEMGILYNDVPDNTTGMTRRMSYKHILKKVKPLINTQWLSMLSEMEKAVNTQLTTEEDW